MSNATNTHAGGLANILRFSEYSLTGNNQTLYAGYAVENLLCLLLSGHIYFVVSIGVISEYALCFRRFASLRLARSLCKEMSLTICLDRWDDTA